MTGRIVARILRGLRSMDEIDQILAWIYGAMMLVLLPAIWALAQEQPRTLWGTAPAALILVSLFLNRLGLWGI